MLKDLRAVVISAVFKKKKKKRGCTLGWQTYGMTALYKNGLIQLMTGGKKKKGSHDWAVYTGKLFYTKENCPKY